MEFESEVYFGCPHCGEQISMLFEVLEGPQTYIEDCEVCCRPILVGYRIINNEVQIERIEPQ